MIKIDNKQEDTMGSEVIAGKKYRHFKGNLYLVLSIATHTESEECLVIYQALYGDETVYARPYDRFFERIDPEKYPEATQEYRFELVEE